MLYVRNVDLAVLGMVGKLLTRSRARIVFEVLDVHPALTRSGAADLAAPVARTPYPTAL